MTAVLSTVAVLLLLLCTEIEATATLATLTKLLNWHVHSNNQLAALFGPNLPASGVESFEDLHKFLMEPAEDEYFDSDAAASPSPSADRRPDRSAAALFRFLPYPIDPSCAAPDKYWYRTADGSCNWLERSSSRYGATGWPMARDYNQTTFTDGFAAPRKGPNAREVSNAFFKRRQRLYFEHTPVLLGLIEFVIHDVVWSVDSKTEFIEVPIPKCDAAYDPNCTGSAPPMRVPRTAPLQGTGTGAGNPRQYPNGATSWLDVSPLYGSSEAVARALRSFVNGKLKAQIGGPDGREYLPFNTMNVPNQKGYKPGTDQNEDLFAGGDPRTNQDWVLLAVHTLLLREHNRICDILISQYSDWDDERLYQTARLVLSSKIQMIANAYQMSYFTAAMPPPSFDGLPLFRQVYGKSFIEMNPAHGYPWDVVTPGGKPMVASHEMSLGYRFHDLIVHSVPVLDIRGNGPKVRLADTQFEARKFMDVGIESILRGMVSSDIPNFKSGVDEDFRSAGTPEHSFDIVAWAIVRERERGLPTFNDYFRAYNGKVPVRVRKTFEEFSSDPEMIANLKRLYKTPDEVDLIVGTQLDEEYFPGTTVPRSALIVSLISLFGLGNSDRLQVGYAIARCFLFDKPWDCLPTTALEELLWEPRPTEKHPRARWVNSFWMEEIGLTDFGSHGLWRLVTENTNIKCLQTNPLFPVNETTNPIICSRTSLLTPPIEFISKRTRTQWAVSVLIGVLTLLAIRVTWPNLCPCSCSVPVCCCTRRPSSAPPLLPGDLPVFGHALAFQTKSLSMLQRGVDMYHGKPFAIRLATVCWNVVTSPHMIRDMSTEDFSLNELLRANNFDLILGLQEFNDKLYLDLIRKFWVTQRETVLPNVNRQTVEFAASSVDGRFSVGADRKTFDDVTVVTTPFITAVLARGIVGIEAAGNDKLLNSFIAFNDEAIKAMGLASLLPSPIRGWASKSIDKIWADISTELLPIVRQRRRGPKGGDFLDYILDATADDNRAVRLAGIIMWGGLTNIGAAFTHTLMDVASDSALQEQLRRETTVEEKSLAAAVTSGAFPQLQRSIVESLRLAANITAPARVAVAGRDIGDLSKGETVFIPKGEAVSVSQYLTHLNATIWPDPEKFDPNRYSRLSNVRSGSGNDLKSPPSFSIRSTPPLSSSPSSSPSSLNGVSALSDYSDPVIPSAPDYLTFGLAPHTCPGRYFALQTLQILLAVLLARYTFASAPVPYAQRFTYQSGQCFRAPAQVTVAKVAP